MAGPPPLPVPTQQFQASFITLFHNANLDPTGGNIAALLAPFRHDLVNANNNTDTQQIKNRLAASGASRHLLAAIIISGGVARTYLLPFRWDDGLAGNNPTLADKYFALEGDLMFNQGHTVELHSREVSSTSSTTTVACFTIQELTAGYANDPAVMMTGPHQANDAGTEPKKSRPLIALPHFLVPLFLAKPEGVTMRHFWTAIYPVIVSEGKQVECAALLDYFQIGATSHGQAGGHSVLDTARPMPPSRSEALIRRQRETLEHFFPQLSANSSQQQTNQIASVIGSWAHQNQQQYEEAKREREATKATSVEKALGTTLFTKLLRLLRLTSEAELIAACPVYLELAKASKAQRLGTVQDKIDKELADRNSKYLRYIMTSASFQNFWDMGWDRFSEDSLTSGFFGNLFSFGEQNEELQRALNLQARLAQSGHTAVSHADAKEILKVTIQPPRPGKALENLKRLDVVNSVLLPAGHPFRDYIKELRQNFDDFSSGWEKVMTKDPAHCGGKDILFAQWVSLRASKYWRAQSLTDLDVPLPSPSELMDDIELSRPWEPQLSLSLRSALKFDQFCRVFNPSPSFHGGGLIGGSVGLDAASIASGLTSTSGSSGSSSGSAEVLDLLRAMQGALQQQGGQQQQGGGGASSGTGTGGGGGGSETQLTNPHFNAALFGEYKTRQVNGKGVRSQDVRKAIKRGDLPALPPSKVNGVATMCLAWHTKGQCSPNCPLKGDHVPYTDEEYQPLCGWCSDNYPRE